MTNAMKNGGRKNDSEKKERGVDQTPKCIGGTRYLGISGVIPRNSVGNARKLQSYTVPRGSPGFVKRKIVSVPGKITCFSKNRLSE